jgi:3-methyl-2-oxobutanoate hydroxymethyltransferase
LAPGNDQTGAASYGAAQTRPTRVTVPALQAMARDGKRIAMLTCYDASFASLCDDAGVDILLVGDSLGMVIQGQSSTLSVSLDETLYHTRCVVAGSSHGLVIADLPFGTYQASAEAAYVACSRALQAGAQMVKLEGGAWLADTVAFLTQRGIPVCGHVGLQPQWVNVLGGYRVQGKTADTAAAMIADARALVAGGCAMLIVECVPRALGARVQSEVGVPVIGIGAGPDCAGQVLVIYDALGITPGKPARFVRNFMSGRDSVASALAAYVAAVREGSFPGPEHCF